MFCKWRMRETHLHPPACLICLSARSLMCLGTAPTHPAGGDFGLVLELWQPLSFLLCLLWLPPHSQ